MANEDKKDPGTNQSNFDPVTGKRKVVLGEDNYPGDPRPMDYTKDITESVSDNSPNRVDRIGYNDTAREVAEAARRLEADQGEAVKEVGFFRKFLNRDEAAEGFNETDRDASPVFDEEKDALTAEESTRGVPMRLLGEDDETETKASRLLREKDYAALASEEISGSSDVPTEKERRARRLKNNFIGGLILAVIGALLFFFAPNIQEMIFKTPDNTLIFNPGSGAFGPRAGIIEILLGLFGIGLIFSTLFTKRKEDSLSKRDANAPKPGNPIRTIGFVMLLLIPIGFASLFNFTEFRNDDIRYSSLFNQNKTAAYSQVSQQEVYSQGEGIFYRIKTADGPTTTMDITKKSLESVKLLDAKLPASRNVNITSEAIEKLVEKEIYSKEEAIRLFIDKR